MSIPTGFLTHSYFSFWVLVAIAWGFGAAITITVLPLTESSEEINQVLLGIYHSHPNGPAIPSETDIAQAYYPEIAQFIISLKQSEPVVGAFLIENGRFQSIPFAIESG